MLSRALLQAPFFDLPGMLIYKALQSVHDARTIDDVATALNAVSAFLTRCCMLEFDFVGARYRVYPTEVEAYCCNAHFQDPYASRFEFLSNGFGCLRFHGSEMYLSLSSDDGILGFMLRSGYVFRNGENVHLHSLPLVGPLHLRQSVFGNRPTHELRLDLVTTQMVLTNADACAIPERFFTMIARRVGLRDEVSSRFAALRLRTISDSTMKRRPYQPKEELLDSYLEIVRLTPEERYRVVRQLVDRCPSKYMLKK